MKIFICIVLILLVDGQTYAHQGNDHSQNNFVNENKDANFLEKIGESYQKNVSHIFQVKCLDCHGEAKKMPWYYSVPGAKQLMNNDMAEAKEHLDMRDGFPFKGHGSPIEDLKAILEVTQKDEMPPFRYRIMHWSSRLSNEEKRLIKIWVKDSLKLLQSEKQ